MTAKIGMALALACSLFASEALAAGLGRLTARSALGEHLDAEVAIHASPEELPSLVARLAGPETFKNAGIDYAPVLGALRLALDRSRPDKPLVRITSTEPIHEPFLQLLIELEWSGGRVVREYTFLLDPPELTTGARPPAVAAPAAPAPAEVKRKPEPPVQKGPVTAARAPLEEAPPSKPREPVSEVQVKAGDTLAKIARAHKPTTVTLDQMLVALFETNPRAFIAGNMNRLRAGAILRLPDAETAAAIDADRARTLVVAQGADFQAWRKRLAGVAAALPAAEAPASQSAAGRIEPRVAEASTKPAPKGDKLEVSRTEVVKSEKSESASLAKLEEELIAREKALAEANQRIAMLEKNLEGLKKLVELKAEGAALRQQQAEAAKAAKTPAQEPPSQPAAGESKPTPLPAEPGKPSEAEKSATPAAPTPREAPPAEATRVAPTAPAPPKPPQAPSPTEAPSFLEENVPLVAGGAGIIALLLAWLGYARWRRKKAAAATQAEELPTDMAAAPEKAARPQEMAELSILQEPTTGEPSSLSELADPLAEAEVLLAYGRDAQAEEILRAALAREPDRCAIHLRLLEIYAARKDTPRFVEVAQALRKACDGKGEDWQKALALAAKLGLPAALMMPGASVAEPSGLSAPAPEPSLPAESLVKPVETASVEKAETAEIDFEIGPVSAEPSPTTTRLEAPTGVAAESEKPPLDFQIDMGAEKDTAASLTQPLDFDLDFEPTLAMTAKEAPAAAEEKKGGGTLDLELDFDFEPAPAGRGEEGLDEAASQTPASTASGFDFSGIDLELEPPTPTAPASEPGTATTAPTSLLPEIDFGLDLEAAESETTGTTSARPGMASILPALGTELPAEGREEAREGTAERATQPPMPASGIELAGQNAAFAAEDEDAEVATKLELADAYEEMGDLEGARELLNEVLNEGNARQRELARARLDRISA
ncbi:MAG: hypothetical protein N2441_09175 [Rhodocyclaceae bacterium]|nr:hypothetical protein [Rhodocyclaceae bacterium]